MTVTSGYTENRTVPSASFSERKPRVSVSGDINGTTVKYTAFQPGVTFGTTKNKLVTITVKTGGVGLRREPVDYDGCLWKCPSQLVG
ncbi:MAG: hypothetical protein NVS3B12_03370 [Acidimicrobiales bacterium]